MRTPSRTTTTRGPKAARTVLIALAGAAWFLLALQPLCAAERAIPAYRIQPGDGLSIQVTGRPEWSLQGTVRPDGRLTYPGIGELTVAGSTIAELTAAIVDALGPTGRHLKHPEVIINATTIRPAVVYVLGSVSRSGTVELVTGQEVAKKILAFVGGAQANADLREVAIYHGDQPREIIDLQAQLDGTAPDTVLLSGDVMVIPEVDQFVGVLGAVSRTGQIALKPGETSIDLLRLVLQLGGLAPNADKDRALILRVGGAVEPVALDKILQRQAPMAQLASGDVLWVLPKADTEYFVVTGAVNTPGRFEYRKDLTLGDALALAGQPAAVAETRNVTLIHKDGTKQAVNIRPLLEGKDPEIARLPVRADDIILVPVQHETYAMLGAIGRPGPAPWEEKLRLADALARAGGPVERVSDLAHTVLVRRAQDGKKPLVMELDARDLLLGKSEAANLVLLPGDMVYIPSLREKSWRDKLDIPLFLLGIFSSIKNILW